MVHSMEQSAAEELLQDIRVWNGEWNLYINVEEAKKLAQLKKVEYIRKEPLSAKEYAEQVLLKKYNISMKDTTSLDTQVGGSHYKNFKIQPVEFIMANEIPFCEANVIKYVVRHKSKNGVEDLLKAKHYLEMLIEAENNNKKEE